MYKRFFKQENGAITLFVLLAMLFFIIIIFSIFMISSNKKQSQTSEIDKIKERYGDSVNNIDQLYNEALTENLSSLLKIGDYVNYTYDTVADGYNLLATESGYANNQTISQTSGLKWRILNIHEDGTIDLIADMSSSSQEVTFKGALGYNNGVYLLNDICKKLYSNSHLGITARSINLEDIENQMNDEGIRARNEYGKNSNTAILYGNTKTYKNNYKAFPNLYVQENGNGIDIEIDGKTEDEIKLLTKKDGIDIHDNGYTIPTKEKSKEAQNSLTVTQTYYYFENTPSSYFYDYEITTNISIIRDMLFGTGTTYWIASRYVHCFSPEAYFGLRFVNISNLFGSLMFGSDSREYPYSSRVRPIITVNITQILPCTGEIADGIDTSISHMHQIKGIYE